MFRKQMVVDVTHEKLPNVSKTELSEKIAKMYKVDPKTVILYGFKTDFGGGKSSGFCLIYDDITQMKKIEPSHRLVRQGHKTKYEASRKQKKERKNREKKVRGSKKHDAASAKKDEKK
uniref:40S ribosomal protein S24 n=1 Tax=Arcella intermedia TaxID=1963864 RepID=A0A6B2LQJ8_9EUKA